MKQVKFTYYLAAVTNLVAGLFISTAGISISAIHKDYLGGIT